MRPLLPTIAALLLAFAPPVAASPSAPDPAAPDPAAVSPPFAPSFEHVSNDEGLAPDLVYCIHQDAAGFLWFGTMHGLVRYDGHEYVTLRHDPFDSTSISCDDVVCIAEDARGDLWVGTYGGGLNRYDRAAGRFDRILPDGPDSTSVSDGILWDVAVGANGIVWAATGRALDRIDPATMRVTHLRHDPASPSSLGPGLPRSVLVRRSGALWVGLQGGGLDSLDASTGTFIHFRADSTRAGDLAGDQVAELLEDREGTLWIGTFDRGLCSRSAGAQEFTRPGLATGWSADLPPAGAQSLHEDADGILWVGTTSGLVRLDPRTREAAHVPYDAARRDGLSGTNVPAVLRDGSGVLWVSCYGQGLDRLLPGGRRFARFGDDAANEARRRILSFVEDREGTLWVGTLAGLIREEGGDLRFFDGDPMQRDAPPPGSVHALAVDREGFVWVGADGGLARWNAPLRKFESWRFLEGEPLTTRSATALLVDRGGFLWVGTHAGVNRLDLTTRRNLRFVHDPQDSTTLADGYVLSLSEDEAGRIWVGSYRGISRIEADRRTITRFRRDPKAPATLGNNYVYAVHTSADGEIWLATAGGLDRFDEAAGTFHHWFERDGLPNAVVASILEDESGALWLGTQRGLARFDPKTRRFTSYDVADGLPSNLFTPGAALRRADGSLLFGGPAGWAAFLPRDLAASDWRAPVVVSGIHVPGRPPSPWADASRVASLRLAPHERTFSIEVAALDFRNPGRRRYATKLDGFDRDWVEAGERRAATYTGLPPGRYHFRARAAGADGVWSESAALPVVVLPPFWRTPAFLASTALFAAAAAFLAQRLHVRSRVRRALDLERARAEERDVVRRRAAADFHDELGHRLARIGLFSELASRRASAASAPEEVQAALARIGDEARRLAGDARDFLWTLGTQSGSLGDLVARLARFGEHLFERTEIEFAVDGQIEELDDVRLESEDRRDLLSIFKEAMTNSLRHARCRTVRLVVDLAGGDFTIALEDDGCGFPRATTASGQGLRNMEWRASKIAGSIEIAPRPGGGTIVALRRRAGK